MTYEGANFPDRESADGASRDHWRVPVVPGPAPQLPALGNRGFEQPGPSSGPAAAPPAQFVNNIVMNGPTKSVGVAILLAFFLGPLGMLYATVVGAVVMFVINFFVALVTYGLGLLITWPVCVIWAAAAASNANARSGARITQTTIYR